MSTQQSATYLGGDYEKLSLLAGLLLLCCAVTAQAQSYEVMNVIGYMYESDNAPGVQASAQQSR